MSYAEDSLPLSYPHIGFGRVPMEINSTLDERYKRLVQAITSSLTASEFCRHLVHSVLVGRDATAALIARLSLDSTFVEVGSYGLDVDGLKRQVTNVFDDNLVALAARKQTWAVSDDKKTFALPLFENGLLAGVVVIALEFRNDREVSALFAEALQIACSQFVSSKRTFGADSRRAASQNQHTPTELSKRQLQILRHLDMDLTYAQIGRALHVSESLVKQEAGRVFRYLGINSRRDAVVVAQQRGITLPEETENQAAKTPPPRNSRSLDNEVLAT
jgi:DNA-binding CsgD family transcriptional regulator